MKHKPHKFANTQYYWQNCTNYPYFQSVCQISAVFNYIEQIIGSKLKLFNFIQWYASEKSENLCSKLFIVQTLFSL
jgi:hypothetical protein